MSQDFLKNLTFGAAYYPEHWDAALWEEDIRRMQEHGLTLLRIGDFAWSKYEFRENQFTIDYYDAFLELCEKHQMQVIFCTPTAAPPEWAVNQYPDILNCDKDGRPYHGDRRFCSYNSKTYQMLCSRLVERLAEHYSKWPCIVGWQIDNEPNCDLSEFYAEADQAAFRVYLQKKFGTLEHLNECMGLTFWNRSYSDWNQIHLSNGGVAQASNPHMMLEQRRFFSESALHFCQMQAEIIRRYTGDRCFITTNGLFANLDYNKLLESGLDFITFDSYPNFAFDLEKSPKAEGNLNDRKWCWNMMWTRSASPLFGIMEQQAGANGWTTRMETPMPRPGQMRLWTMQAIAHGANLINYFRWRTSPIGCEIYWHGLNDYANTDNRRLRELKQITTECAALQELAEGTYRAEVAILKDYTNVWDAATDIWHGRVDYYSENSWFTAAQLSHTPCDFKFIRPDTTLEELRQYKLLVYPHAAIMTEETATLLSEYVKAGGVLVFGARTGYKDEFGRCPMRPMPGLIDTLCGVEVEDYTLASPAEPEMTISWEHEAFAAPVFHEILRRTQPDTEVLASFDGSYYQGKPALCRRKYGAGTVYYFGGCFSTELAEKIMQTEGVAEPLHALVSAPECVEAAVREHAQGRYLFLLNYDANPAKIELKTKLWDVMERKEEAGSITMAPFDVRVFKI